MEKKYSIQWCDPNGMGFWIRGIKPDGSFYGELMYAFGDATRSAGTFVEGRIPAEDWTECQRLIGTIGRLDDVLDNHWVGQLAVWTESIASPQVLYRYVAGDDGRSVDAQKFIEVRQIVEKQLSEHYTKLLEFSKKSHNP